MKTQLADTKVKYESRIAAMEAENGMLQEERFNSQINELKLAHEEQIINLERDR